jgi:hypothetical protein
MGGAGPRPTAIQEAWRRTVNDELEHIFGDDPDLVDEDAPLIDPLIDADDSIPGGTDELVALAAHDANDLLRFIESAMSEAEAEAFLADVRGRDPETATRLLQMRDDQRLLRTSLGLEPAPQDLLGPVRAQLARDELVQIQSEIGSEAADPTEFMARSVASLARRRRRARRRPFALAAIFGMIGVAVGIIAAPRFAGREGDAVDGQAVTAPPSDESAVAAYGLLISVRDRHRAELAIALIAAEHGAVLVRTISPEGDPAVDESLPLVGSTSSAPTSEVQRELGGRGFDLAVVVDRSEVSMVLAEVGGLAVPAADGRPAAVIVPSSGEDPRSALTENAWQSWSHQSEAARGLPADVRRLVVPLAIVESPG